MTLNSEEIQIINNCFKGKPVIKAYIFGSYARNEANYDSDIDILVELDYNQHLGLGFIDLKLELEEKLHKKVDLISNNAISKHIAPFINSDKKMIYER